MSETLKDTRKAGWFWSYNRVLDEFVGKIDVYAFATYMLLCRHAMNRGRVECSLRFIAKSLSISLGKASEVVVSLEDNGLIAVEKSGDGKPRTYVLLDLTDDDSRSPSELVRSSGDTGLFTTRTNSFTTRTTNNEVRSKNKNKPSESDCATIYALYPRRVAKRAALKAIEKAWVRLRGGEYSGNTKPDESFILSYLLTRVSVFAKSRAGEDEKFTPFPATWFNGSRYLDNFGEGEVSSETSDGAGDAVVSALDKVRKQLRGGQQ